MIFNIKVLDLYIQLRDCQFGTDDEIYIEISKRIEVSKEEIKKEVNKYLKEYEKYLKEIKNEKTFRILNFEGLTEKKSSYVAFRFFGYDKKEAMKRAGFSSKTKAADIEKDPRVQTVMQELQKELREDVKLGAKNILNRFISIAEKAENGVEYQEQETTVTETADGPKTSTRLYNRKKISYSAAIKALENVARMLGYSLETETKLQPTSLSTAQEKLAEMRAKKLERELKDQDNEPKVLK